MFGRGKDFPLEWKQMRKKMKTFSTFKDKTKLERLKNL
jgi:hypothetical protein